MPDVDGLTAEGHLASGLYSGEKRAFRKNVRSDAASIIDDLSLEFFMYSFISGAACHSFVSMLIVSSDWAAFIDVVGLQTRLWSR